MTFLAPTVADEIAAHHIAVGHGLRFEIEAASLVEVEVSKELHFNAVLAVIPQLAVDLMIALAYGPEVFPRSWLAGRG